MKAKEELEKLKEECMVLNSKLKELNDDELKEVTGGIVWLYEESYDVLEAANKTGSIQEVIGGWSNKEH